MMRRVALAAFAPLLLAAAPDRESGKPVDPAEETLHTVKGGETLAGVAKRAGVERVLIVEANGLKPPYDLRTGQRLVIPRQRRHVVKAGETGFAIAYGYGVPWKGIATANSIDAARPLKPGQVLIIPAINPSATSLTPPTPERPLDKPKPASAARAESLDDSDHPDFAWPAEGRLRRGFSARGGHGAIDLAGDEGAPVRAAAKGRVAFAGEEPKKFGNLVVIDHGNGWFTAYAKLQKVLVRKGGRVRRGERVGLLGHSGETSATELHFEIRRDNMPVDPIYLLPSRD